MGLEHWDASRSRWVLYRSAAEHGEDCRRHPFEQIPRDVFLDTSVINLLIKHSEAVFEQAGIPDGLSKTRAHDIEALMHVFYVGARASWTIRASSRSIAELEKTPDSDLREELLEYGVALFEHTSPDRQHAGSLGRRLIDAPFMAILRDEPDRELIGNAIGYGCDAFCTADRRSIVRKRERLKLLPLRIITPVEWWAHVKPWGRLWV
jgi:hypothetical protein